MRGFFNKAKQCWAFVTKQPMRGNLKPKRHVFPIFFTFIHSLIKGGVEREGIQ